MLSWLIAGSQGGYSRLQILSSLRESPSNANQLATLLQMDYTTIRYHLKILEDNRLVVAVGKDYAQTYVLSSLLEENYESFKEISEIVLKKAKKTMRKTIRGSSHSLAVQFMLLKSMLSKCIHTVQYNFCFAFRARDLSRM